MKSIGTQFLQSMALQYDLKVWCNFFSFHLASQEEYHQTNLWNSSIQWEIIKVNTDNLLFEPTSTLFNLTLSLQNYSQLQTCSVSSMIIFCLIIQIVKINSFSNK
jgi:hypothetical protein